MEDGQSSDVGHKETLVSKLIKDKDQKSQRADGGQSLLEVKIEKDFVTLVSSWLTIVSDAESYKRRH